MKREKERKEVLGRINGLFSCYWRLTAQKTMLPAPSVAAGMLLTGYFYLKSKSKL
jgi:hypothetical protein